MSYQILTRSDRPQVVDLSKWREECRSTREAEGCLTDVASPAQSIREREEAISESVKGHGLLRGSLLYDIGLACDAALRRFRKGESAASAIQAGRDKLTELGHQITRRPPPKGAA